MFKTFLGLVSLAVLLTLGLCVSRLDEHDRTSDAKPIAPMQVQLSFSSPPHVGQPTTLNLSVTALDQAPNTTIRIDLPKEGFTVMSGEIQLTQDLSPNTTINHHLVVLPISYGQFKITGSATSELHAYRFGDTDDLYVSITNRETQLSDQNMVADESVQSAIEVTSETSESSVDIVDDGKPASLKSQAVLAPSTGQIAVRGIWKYRDRNGTDRVLRDARVEIWDSDTLGDDLLATVHTNNSGFFETSNLSNSDGEGGTQDIYVKVFSTDDFSVTVTNFSSSMYFAQSATRSNVPDGFVDIGTISITDVNNRMAYYIYDVIANDAYDYLVNNVGWVNSFNLQVRWSPTNTSDGTHYHPGGTVDLLAGDRWDVDVFLHEYGHFVMYKIYGNVMPSAPNCGSHRWGSHFSLGCAWVEGWANFLQAAIQNDRFYDDTEDQNLHIDYEPPDPPAHHAEDEGAVAASLWDIFDSNSESWDALNDGVDGIWSIVFNRDPIDVIQFYESWLTSSNGSNSQMTSILQHHDVIPNPTLTASLTLNPSQPYVVGQTVNGTFSITNRGNRTINLEVLTIGGRLNTDSNVVDFPVQTNVALGPNQTRQYVGSFTFQQSGNYRFFPAYRLQGGVWRIGLLGEIPKDPGIVDLLSFSVNTSCSDPGAFSLNSPNNGQSLSTTSSVTLNWQASANADSYDVYFGTSSNPPFVGNQTGTSRTVTVTPGQTYFWKVVARVNCSSVTKTAGVWSFTIQQTCNSPGVFSLSSPSNGQSLSSTTSVNLTWGSSANANSYDVYFGTSSNPPFIGNQSGTSRTVTVTPGQTYFWKVVAKVNCGSATTTAGIWSFTIQQTCNSPGVFSLSSPSNGQTLPSTTSVNLTWGSSANANSYDVYFGTSSNPPFIGNQTGTSRTVTVTPGETYFWKVVAKVNCSSITITAGVSSFSVQQSGCTYRLSSTDNTVGPGTGSTNFQMDTTSGCSWSAVSDSPSWLTTSSSGTGDGQIRYDFASNNSTSPRTGHITAGGQVHTVTQIGLGGGGSVQFSSSAYSVNENGGTVTLTVTRSGGTHTGTVQYSTSNGSATAGSDYTETSGLLLFGSNEMSKSFTVAVLDDSAIEGNESINLTLKNPSLSFTLGSPSTATVTIIDNDTLLPPSATAASGMSSNGFTANWGSSGGAAGYRLDVSTNSSFSSFVSGYQNLDIGNALSRSVTGLSSSTTYFYRVRAYNSAFTSTNSNTVNVSTSGPMIFIEEGTTNRAAALDSVTWLRGPFRVVDLFNFSSDRHTRVILFTSDLGLSQPDSSQLTVRAGGILLAVENVGPVLGVPGMGASYIVVRLPDGLQTGDQPLIVTLRGLDSVNSPTLSISP